MKNAEVAAAALIGVSAGAAHFILPQPPQAEAHDLHRRFAVGAGVILLAGVAAAMLTKNSSYLLVAVVGGLLTFAAYQLALKLERDNI